MGIGGALLGGAVVGGAASLFGSSKASSAAKSAAGTQAAASTEAAQISAQSQREQLEYLKEVNKLPQQYREEALTQLAGGVGIGEGPGQQAMIDQAKASPIYGAIMEGQGAGEEAILRGAAATGGLRSGNVQENLAEFGSGLQNQALLTAYNDRQNNLNRLAGLDTGTAQISNVMGNIGQTQAQGVLGAGTAMAQGQVASGQAWQQGLQNVTNIGLGTLGAGIQAGYFGKGGQI